MLQAQYQYEPFRPWAPSIRLISFLQCRDDGTLDLRLERFSLENVAYTYTAISYTWGSNVPSHKVWINDAWILIPESAWRFLNHCCNTDFKASAPSRIWIDSVCIDQGDLEERNTQVRIMGDIFCLASKVLIWLGDVSQYMTPVCPPDGLRDHEDEDQHADCGRRVASKHHLLRKQQSLLRIQGTDPSLPWSYCWTSRHSVFSLLQKIVDHDYWQRMWIVQEVLLARKALIILGSTTISLEELQHIEESWRNDLFGSSHQAYIQLDFLYNFWKKQAYQTWRLNDLLAFVGKRKCRDIRDRVYGIIGMCELDSDFDVDYACTKDQLARRALRLIKQQTGPESELYGFHRLIHADYIMEALDMSVTEFVHATLLVKLPEGRSLVIADANDELNYAISINGQYWYDPDHPEWRFQLRGLEVIPAAIRSYWELLLQRGWYAQEVSIIYVECVYRKDSGNDNGSYSRHWWQLASKGFCDGCCQVTGECEHFYLWSEVNGFMLQDPLYLRPALRTPNIIDAEKIDEFLLPITSPLPPAIRAPNIMSTEKTDGFKLRAPSPLRPALRTPNIIDAEKTDEFILPTPSPLPPAIRNPTPPDPSLRAPLPSRQNAVRSVSPAKT